MLGDSSWIQALKRSGDLNSRIIKIVKKQLIAAIISILPLMVAGLATGAERDSASALSGFYGGVALRDSGVETKGMALGIPANALSRFSPRLVEDSSPRSLLFGGYRWRNEVAVEASFNAADPYALKPSDGFGGRRGVGVVPASSTLGFSDLQARTWNADLFTSWSFYRSFALYGRLGYAQTDFAPTFAGSGASTVDTRRLRDGVNYGLGVRYDMTSALGLRLEYGRFGRFAGEIGSPPLESDQVTFGLQFRF